VQTLTGKGIRIGFLTMIEADNRTGAHLCGQSTNSFLEANAIG
jgi:hypothetical protein